MIITARQLTWASPRVAAVQISGGRLVRELNDYGLMEGLERLGCSTAR